MSDHVAWGTLLVKVSMGSSDPHYERQDVWLCPLAVCLAGGTGENVADLLTAIAEHLRADHQDWLDLDPRVQLRQLGNMNVAP